jgi:hypothetical protein
MKVDKNTIQELIFSCIGCVLGLFYAHHEIQHNIAVQLQHHRWVCYTGLDSYVIYGPAGMFIGFYTYALVKFIIKCYR